MGKMTFMGAGSTVFARNVMGDMMLTEALRDFEIALYDIDAERLDACGYPMFSGELILEREFDVDDTNKHVILEGRGINSIHMKINGEDISVKMFPPYKTDISKYLKSGKNTIELRIINNLRNMQGPLHFIKGDEAGITPSVFFRESNVFRCISPLGEKCHDVIDHYTDDYGLVHFGLKY